MFKLFTFFVLIQKVWSPEELCTLVEEKLSETAKRKTVTCELNLVRRVKQENICSRKCGVDAAFSIE